MRLVVEVARTSLRYDTTRKARDYASWGVAEYWVVDVVAREPVIHRSPRRDDTRSVERIGEHWVVPVPEAEATFRLAQMLTPAD